MRKTTLYYILDIIMGLLALLLFVNTFLLWVVLPQGFYASRRLWLDLHKWGGLALGVTVLLHIVLHWDWLRAMTRRLLRRPKAERGSSALEAGDRAV